MTDIHIIILADVDHNIRLFADSPISQPVVIDSAVSDEIKVGAELIHLLPTPAAMAPQPETVEPAENPLRNIDMGDGSILNLSAAWQDDGSGNLIRVD